jgi:tetratricopeptide (TPR) repeat protein
LLQPEIAMATVNALLMFVFLFTTSAAAQPPTHTNPNVERARTHYLRGWENMRAEAFDRAVLEFSEAIELHPKFAMAHYSLGRAYLALHRYVDAITALATCSELYSVEGTRDFNSQLDANRQRQDRLLELQDLRAQVSKGPQNVTTQDTMRQVDNAIRLTTNAFDRGQNIALEHPVPSFVSLSLGSAYFRAEQFEKAEQQYRAAIATDPKAGEAHNNLAVVLMMKAQYAEALAELKAAEKAGFRVNPELRDQIKSRMGSQ